MKLYIAAKFEQRAIAVAIAEMITAMGHHNTALWVSDPDDPEWEPQVDAERDLADIERANALLLLPPHTGGCGCWVEMGYALALRKPVFVLGSEMRSVFHHLDGVRMIERLEEIPL